MLQTRVSQIARAVNSSAIELYAQSLKPATKAMDDGTIWHSLILEGKFPDNIKVFEYNDYKKDIAQKEKKQAIASGLMPMLSKDLEVFSRTDLTEIKALLEGYEVERQSKMMRYKGVFRRKEFSFEFNGKLDAISFEKKNLIDLKCTNALTFSKITERILYNGYDVQVYLYLLLNVPYEQLNEWTATILFFNAETGVTKPITMRFEDIQESCYKRINERAYPTLVEFDKLKNGLKVLNTGLYFPFE